MDNAQIADCFSLLAKLMDIHGENSFKAKSYANTAFTVDKLTVQLSTLPTESLFSIKGIGESGGKKIIELLETGELLALNQMIKKTPYGILEMLNIKGIGPKKIATIWKEMELESVGELLYACKENRLKLYKGFGEKTQQNVIETIEYYLKSKGGFLYSQVEALVFPLKSFFEKVFYPHKFQVVGAYARQLESMDAIEIVVDNSLTTIQKILVGVSDFELIEKNSGDLLYNTIGGLKIRVYGSDKIPFVKQVFLKNSSLEFQEFFTKGFPAINYSECENEVVVFEQAGIRFIPAFQREKESIIEFARHNELPPLLQLSDIKGIIHCHSDWSDGNNTIEQMAIAAIAKGLEYLVISDHSKSAFYAKGLSEERVQQQHLYINELNKKLAPFKIFKSIESDILNDGNLDYSNAILSTFDLVIASIHSNLKMPQEKAMMRLLSAIENPYTTILGHMTGRLLLSRKGYPVDHKKIIDACAANNVVIELNAHPSRLDIDWRHIDYALEKNVLLSIDPDAHSIEGFDDVRYGILVAQKVMLTKAQNLSSFGAKELEIYLDRKNISN